MEEVIYLIADEEGNLFTVKNWEDIFANLSLEELEDLYIICKYYITYEETIIKLKNSDLIEPLDEEYVEPPLEGVQNSLIVMSEKLGDEVIKTLDDRVLNLFQQNFSSGNQSNGFLHLN